MADLRDVLRDTGAVDTVEASITALADEATAVVDGLRRDPGPEPLDETALQVLGDLVAVCTARDT